MLGQWGQGGLIHLLEGATAATGQLLKGAVVQLLQQTPNRHVGLDQAEELAVAQVSQYPALHYLHPALHLGLVPRLSDPSGQDRHVVVLGELVVGTVEVGLVEARLGHPRLEVVGHDGLGHSAEEL